MIAWAAAKGAGRFRVAAAGMLFLFCLAPLPSAPGDEKPAKDTEFEAAEAEVPVVLVHGFSGWGREDLSGFHYWGGFTDLQEELRAAGHVVYAASIGPFSSNWDRACELYACIKGGRVDYGEHHAAVYGHKRYGQRYPGVYPQWSEENPVHLIGHSMGGQTARLLAHLLRHGDPDEYTSSGSDCHELFHHGGQWVKSITTISTPHDGTTLAADIDLVESIIHAVLVGVTTAVESGIFPEFDLKMDHWGISRRPDEPLVSYFSRVRKNKIWSTTKRDFSLWDISLEGAAALNRRAPAEPDVYYFSYANEQTATGPVASYQVPEIGMFASLIPGALFIGSYVEDGISDKSWWTNDGAVSTCSMKAPTRESHDMVVDFDGTPQPGEWNYMGLLSSMDHVDVIGIPSADDQIIDLYTDLCEMLAGLPE